MFEKVSGKKIKEAIKQSRMTQAQAAEKLGVKQSFISQMINEKTNVSLENLKKIAEITGKPLEFFAEKPEEDVSYGKNENINENINFKFIMNLIEENNKRDKTYS